jgi:hypothetical protein
VSEDVLGEFDHLIHEAERADAEAEALDVLDALPWTRTSPPIYRPNLPLLIDLLTGPLADKATTQSGRLAKAFDAWIAYELRRAKLDPAEVWPRARLPRVFSRELHAVQQTVDTLADWLGTQDAAADAEARKAEERGDAAAVAGEQERRRKEDDKRARAYEKKQTKHEKQLAEARQRGRDEPAPPLPPEPADRVPVQAGTKVVPAKLRSAINAVVKSLQANSATNVLGRFYVKQVDVVVSSWDRGPDVLVSGKTMFSSYGKNTKNRYEETLGEATNLRDRHPLAAMGYAFLVNEGIFREPGAYGRLQDLLERTRKPHGPYDATMLLIASWDAEQNQLELADSRSHHLVKDQQPPVDLSAKTFFTDLLNAVIVNTPVGIHQQLRDYRNRSTVPGGAPNPVADADDAAEDRRHEEAPES